uniref:Thioredoxin n=1 Tax=Azumapecten farreri TaxID=106299 RepID=Q4L0D7_AZUFA|nr:thioredoxin [Azumapecten farreri]
MSETGKVIGLKTKADFDECLQTDKLVVIDFFADWCGPCKQIAPAIEELAKANTDVIFRKVNVDENDETAQACEISAMPTFRFYKSGQTVDEVVGANKGKIEEYIVKNE